MKQDPLDKLLDDVDCDEIFREFLSIYGKKYKLKRKPTNAKAKNNK